MVYRYHRLHLPRLYPDSLLPNYGT